MSVGGIGADVPMMIPDAAAAADAAAPAALPDPAALLLPPAPEALPFVADGFTPQPDRDPVAHLGAGDAPTQSAALADLRAAKRDLRQAKREPEGTAGRRHDIRVARRDVRQAKAELQDATSGGAAIHGINTADTFAARPFDPGLLPFADDVDATATAAQLPTEPGLALGRTLPNINQLNPAGHERGYTNGDMNCAPTAMAMVARGHPEAMLDGKPVAQMSDAELINRLGRHGETDQQGTSPNGAIAMAEEMGLSTSSRQGGFNPNYYDAILAKGGSVIANGAYPINGEMAGHFVTVTAKTPDGNYLVNDPLLGRTVVCTPAELDAFLLNNPVNGGVSIGVA